MSKEQKTILLTFDYELFLGKDSGSVNDCLINPTNAIVKVLDRYKAKGIFFVDCTYLVELKKVAEKYDVAFEDYKLINSQLRSLIKQGHYIYPHIHPHWVDAVYNADKNSWTLTNLEKYSFANLSLSLQQQIFSNALDLLQAELGSKEHPVMLNAYRAGGWSIQPFSHFKPLFEKYKVSADFSVLGGSKIVSDAQRFDFTKICENATPYNFENEVDEPLTDGTFTEFPINSIVFNKKSLLNRVLLKVLWRTAFGQSMGKGVGVSPEVLHENIAYNKNFQMLSVELLTHLNLSKYKNYLNQNDYMQFVSHPKMISKYNLKVLSKLLNHADRKFECNYNWIHYLAK